MINLVQDYFASWGLSYSFSVIISFFLMLTLAFVTAIFADFIARKYLIKFIDTFLLKIYKNFSKFQKKHHLIKKIARLGPALVLYIIAPLFDFPELEFTKKISLLIQKLALIYMVISLAYAFQAILDVTEDLYNIKEISKKRPIKSYIQVLKILSFIVAAVFIISIILQQSPLVFLTGLGATIGIFVIVFKDSIASFIASIQLASHDMIRIGDWINISKYGADGHVSEISLSTVKVRNFDKTITTVPTDALLKEGVKNWRGMYEIEGRRIKRSINIDLNSIRFIDENIYQNLEKANILSNALTLILQKTKKTTNVSLFRQYMQDYIEQHEDLQRNQNFLTLVRQLQATQHGMPLEVYVFTKTTSWKDYEKIQSEIFEHFYAVLPYFDLRAFQNVAGSDLKYKLQPL